MKRYLIIGLLLLVALAFVISIFRNTDESESGFPASFDLEDGNFKLVYGKDLPLAITVNEEGVKKIELIYNDSIFTTWDTPKKGKLAFRLDADFYGVGARNIILRSYPADGGAEEDSRVVRVLSDVFPALKTAKVITVYPHDVTNYTQGLEFNDGQLYESTGDPGQKGASKVGKVDMSTGQYIVKNGLDATYFGEGITILGNEIFQLTWRNQKCFVYDKNDLTIKLKEFNYPGEGWGLCNDGKYLIMSDGTERITFRDPKTFAVVRTIEVYDTEGPRINLNELEYVNGKIYANIYTTSYIVVIDPNTGKVLEQIDATPLEAVGKMGGEVLNGIAYDGKDLYMTGKYWGKIMKVSIDDLP
jgi:glutaminyl-peptide cyclotransferase